MSGAALLVAGLFLAAQRAPEPPLHEAVQAHDVARVRALLASGAKVNEVCGNGSTALLEATEGSRGGPYLELVRELLKAGADVKHRTTHQTVLSGPLDDFRPSNAAQTKELVQLLLAAGADPLEPTGDPAYGAPRPFRSLRASTRGTESAVEADELLSMLAVAEVDAWVQRQVAGPAEVEADALIWGGAASSHAAVDALTEAERALSVLARNRYASLRVTPAAGFPRLVKSDRVEGLKPGLLPVVLGFCATSAGEPTLARLKQLVDPRIYARRVKVPKAALSCPEVTTFESLPTLTHKRRGATLAATEIKGAEGGSWFLLQAWSKDGYLRDVREVSAGGDGCALSLSPAGDAGFEISNSCQRYVSQTMCDYPESTRTGTFGVSADGGITEQGDLDAERTPSACGE